MLGAKTGVTRTEIEIWANNVIERVVRNQPTEDDHVELKTEYVEAKKAARRIAGHANAAKGTPILWLFGVDEKKGTVPGVEAKDFATWYDQVRAEFDEVVPEMTLVNVPFQGQTVVATCFETDRAPYVVRNPKLESVQFEVPWRRGTRVESATRIELLRLLSSQNKLPRLEVLGARLTSTKALESNDYEYKGIIAFFVEQPVDQTSVFSNHKCTFWAYVPDRGRFTAPDTQIQFWRNDTSLVTDARTTARIRGPGKIEVSFLYQPSYADLDLSKALPQPTMGVGITPAGIDTTINVTVEMEQMEVLPHGHRWKTGTYTYPRDSDITTFRF